MAMAQSAAMEAQAANARALMQGQRVATSEAANERMAKQAKHDAQQIQAEVERANRHADEAIAGMARDQEAFVQNARVETGQYAGRQQSEAEQAITRERQFMREEIARLERELAVRRAAVDADADTVSIRAEATDARNRELKKWENVLLANEQQIIMARDDLERQRLEFEQVRLRQEQTVAMLDARSRAEQENAQRRQAESAARSGREAGYSHQ